MKRIMFKVDEMIDDFKRVNKRNLKPNYYMREAFR